MARDALDRSTIYVAKKVGSFYIAVGDMVEVSLVRYPDSYDVENELKRHGLKNGDTFKARVIDCSDYNIIELDLSKEFESHILSLNYCYIRSIEPCSSQ